MFSLSETLRQDDGLTHLCDYMDQRPAANTHTFLRAVWAWWDVSWWIAILFTFGSALFVVSSLFYWLPLAAPQTEFPGESLVGGGVCSFIGATLFTVGGLLLIVEAANENQTGCFGWAVEHLFVAGEEGECRTAATGAEIRPRPEACRHRLHNRELRHGGIHLQHPSAGRRWEWAPTWREMRAHYLHEIGFLAAFIMAVGAVVFYVKALPPSLPSTSNKALTPLSSCPPQVSGIMSLPGITNTLSLPTLLATYWLAYLLGGLLFTLSSLLYVLETQRKWYMPAPRVLGWWIGVFDLLGSVGWMLSAIFGYCTGVASWCVYQSDLTTLWASCCFLIASLGLWFEALDKYPVYRARE